MASQYLPRSQFTVQDLSPDLRPSPIAMRQYRSQFNLFTTGYFQMFDPLLSIMSGVKILALLPMCLISFVLYRKLRTVSSLTIFTGFAIMTASHMGGVTSALVYNFGIFPLSEKWPISLSAVLEQLIFDAGLITAVFGFAGMALSVKRSG